MNLATDFQFPTLSKEDIIFSTLETDSTLLGVAKERKFDDHNNPYVRLANQFFFSGGKLKFKPGLDPVFKERATNYLRAFMASFEPSHEEKEAICGLLLSELVQL